MPIGPTSTFSGIVRPCLGLVIGDCDIHRDLRELVATLVAMLIETRVIHQRIHAVG